MTDDRTPLSPFATDPDEELYAEIERLEERVALYIKGSQFQEAYISNLLDKNILLQKELDTLRNPKHPAY
jgi:hypothetical protein